MPTVSKANASTRKRAFIREMVQAGVPIERSRRLATRLWHVAKPSADTIVAKDPSGKNKHVYVAKTPARGRQYTIYFTRESGRIVIHGLKKASASGKKTKGHR